MESWGLLVGVLSAVIALAGGLLGIFKYIQSQRDAAYLYTDKAVADEAKRRHDLAGQTQVSLGKVESNLRTLEREAVRREDLVQMESRMMTGLNKLESKIENVSDKLDKKLDRLLAPADPRRTDA